MKKLLHLMLAGLALLILQANSCVPETAQTGSEVEVVMHLDPPSFSRQMKTEPGMLIDVRTHEEFLEASIAGAVNIDIESDSFKPEINKLDKSETYYLYCHSGTRSATAAGYMEEVGFARVYNLESGIAAWMEMNFPVIRQVVPADVQPQASKAINQ